MYQNVCVLITNMVGNEYLYLDKALYINMHLNIWGMCVSPTCDLYVMNSDQEWHQVEPNDTVILEPLHARLLMVKHHYIGPVVNGEQLNKVLDAIQQTA
jgi:hypothetical protein